LPNTGLILAAIFDLLLIAGIWSFIVGRALFRSRMAPICWRCGAWKVAPDTNFRRSDVFALFSLMVPMRCGGCLRRFYGVRGVAPQQHRPSWQLENRNLRTVDRSSTLIAFLYTVFRPEEHRPVIRLRVQLPAFLARRVSPVEDPAPSADSGLSVAAPAQDLASLLHSLVAEQAAANANEIVPDQAETKPDESPATR
jgi:hypothetical protein